jgi:hypothetical protein
MQVDPRLRLCRAVHRILRLWAVGTADYYWTPVPVDFLSHRGSYQPLRPVAVM